MSFFRQCALACMGWFGLAVHAVDRQEMVDGLIAVHNIIQAGYAPLDWKREFLNWNEEATFGRAEGLVFANQPLYLKGYHQIVRDCLGSLHDHHVSVLFFSTESATLPFSVQYVQGKYLVDWVDTKRLPEKSYTIQVGDELQFMDGVSVEEIAASLDMGKWIPMENQATDSALLAMRLTMRFGDYGDIVPQGPITLGFAKKDETATYSYQIMWQYEPEWIQPLPPLHSLFGKIHFLGEELHTLSMISPWHQSLVRQTKGRPGTLGAKKSFVPELGEIVWSSEQGFVSESSSINRFFSWFFRKIPYFGSSGGNSDDSSSKSSLEESCWYAYIYRSPEGRLIGYVRIPTYDRGEAESQSFGELMNFLEERTEALVIDQVNNPGGYAWLVYDLCSILAKEPLVTPRHRLKLTQLDVVHSRKILDSIQKLLQVFDDTDDIDTSWNSSEIDSLVDTFDYQKLLFYKAYHEFILKEWAQGHFFTDPTHIEGVDHVNPHPVYRYRKPLLLLINSLDFSGGDFFPYILKSNQRALIFGSKTAGAGGCVSSTAFTNQFGIRMLTYTSSIAEGLNGEKIENLGVSPDIPYEITREDLLNGYEGYKNAVNTTLENMLNCGQF